MSSNATWWVLLALALVLVVGVVVIAVLRREPLTDSNRLRPHRPHTAADPVADEPADRRRAAIIVNPTKFDDLAQVKRQVTAVCLRHGWAEPLFIETTEDDPGTGQAADAVEQGVDLVCPLGGDGTVRAVAAGLAGTDTPMGLLPGGTGNLLARNLGLPIDSLDDALDTALTGRDHRIDVGRMEVRSTPGDEPTADDVPSAPGEEQPSDETPPTEHIFLVMAGIGFDAAVMDDAPEDLKKRVGWAAYVVSAAKHLSGDRFRVLMTVDGRQVSRRVRSVVIGNVGELQGGIKLLPDAQADDGNLDAVVIAPKGVVGWGAVIADVATRHRRGHSQVEHYSGREFVLEADAAEHVQLDGDTIGRSDYLKVWVDPGQLTVRLSD